MTAVQRHRLRARLTITQLAKRAGVSEMTVYRAEASQPISDATLFKLAEALGVDDPLELRENGDRPQEVA